MARLIDANFLKAEFTGNFQSEYTVPHIHALIETAPTIDAVPVVHGEWKLFCDGWFEYHVCSLCGERTMDTVLGKPRAKYCPNCGAKMDGGENSEKIDR